MSVTIPLLAHVAFKRFLVTVRTHVAFQITRCTKTLLAHITLVRFLVRVNTHVIFQSIRMTKRPLAHITLVRFLVRVNTHVSFQMTRLTKSFITNITFVRFLVRVNTHVLLQITRITKTLLAHITFIRFLVRVRTHMSGQIGWCSKHLLANTALVLLRSLPLRSFLFKSRFFFLYLMIRLEIIILIRNPQTQHSFFSLSFFSLLCGTRNHHRLYVYRAFRMFILSSRHLIKERERERSIQRGKKKLRRFAGINETNVVEKSTE